MDGLLGCVWFSVCAQMVMVSPYAYWHISINNDATLPEQDTTFWSLMISLKQHPILMISSSIILSLYDLLSFQSSNGHHMMLMLMIIVLYLVIKDMNK